MNLISLLQVSSADIILKEFVFSVVSLLGGAEFVGFLNEYESGNTALLLNSVSSLWQWLVPLKCMSMLAFPLIPLPLPIQNSLPATSTLGTSCALRGLLKSTIGSSLIIIKLTGLNLKPYFLPQCLVLTAKIKWKTIDFRTGFKNYVRQGCLWFQASSTDVPE